jgi:hypothetical protein
MANMFEMNKAVREARKIRGDDRQDPKAAATLPKVRPAKNY